MKSNIGTGLAATWAGGARSRVSVGPNVSRVENLYLVVNLLHGRARIDTMCSTAIRLTVLAASVFAAACGDSGKPSAPLLPTAPSAVAPAPIPPSPGITGNATISGVVAGSSSSAMGAMRMTAAGTGLTVTVTGSGVTATVGPGGTFMLTGVPSGTVELHFSGPGIDARGTIDNVGEQEEVKVTVNINGSTAKVDVSQRSKPDNKVELEGRIDSVNVAARSFRVRDANVVVAPDSVIRHGDRTLSFSDLHVGDEVHVRGTRNGNDVVASEVKLQNDEHEAQEAEVQGQVAGLLPGTCPVRTFTVNGVKVSTDATTQFSDGTCAQLANGTKVEVKGTRQTDGSVKAAKVKLEEAEHKEAEVEGKISGLTGTGTCPVLTFSVNTTKVSTDLTTAFSGGTCKQLANDMKVEVKGTRQSDGSVKAAKVKLEDSGKK